MAWNFGIKEVADVEFIPLDTVNGKYLKFDTLKVSNLEFTSEEAFARGGKGNPKLITWDYNREATLTLQDAILSMDTLAMIFGDNNATDTSVTIGADTYPGFYEIIGTTYAKGTNGTEKLFKFTIHKAKVSSNVTLTMEAEGDPTVFDMTVTVLKPDNANDLMTLELLENLEDENKVTVKLVATDGKVTTHYLTVGSEWSAAGITPTNYNGMPEKVTGGLYYAKA